MASLPPLMPLIETVLSPNYHQVWVGAPVAPKWPLGDLRCTSVALVPPGGGAEGGWERHTPTPHNTAHPRSRVITVELFLADSATEAAGPQVVPYSHRLPAAPAAERTLIIHKVLWDGTQMRAFRAEARRDKFQRKSV